MRVPDDARIRAPEFPPATAWLNGGPLRMRELEGSRATLVEFFDLARVNSHRTLPYLRAWDDRYRDRGLQVVGVHAPGYSFSADPGLVAHVIERLEIAYPVAIDSAFEIWRAYGNRGWPGRYLFDPAGMLRWVQYGEGEYVGCERAIQDALTGLDPGFAPPPPLAPVRPEDAEGALLAPQTADVALPRDRERLALDGDWSEGEDYLEAGAAGARARVRSYSAGEAHAVVAGTGVAEPGIRICDGEVEAPGPGFRLYGFQFTPARAATAGVE
jgi:hypothetical protein